VSLIRVTPCVPLAAPERVWLKLENLQRTGSFKLRGAARKLRSLDPEARGRGVVTASAGNHGAGLALAARALGVHVQVVVPEGTPANKRRRIADLGADLVVEGAGYDQAEAAARLRASTQGAVFVSPFDDDEVIAGNGGELGAELMAQRPSITRVVCPVGGGGLIAGLAAALAPRGVEVWGVQPRANCAMYDSLARGRALTTYEGGPTLAEGCDGAVAERTFALVREHAAGVVLVDEPAIRRALGFCYREAGQRVEPTAAVAVAGLLEHALPAHDGETCVVISGGNVDDEVFDSILES
jgi:threonine dehydratase